MCSEYTDVTVWLACPLFVCLHACGNLLIWFEWKLVKRLRAAQRKTHCQITGLLNRHFFWLTQWTKGIICLEISYSDSIDGRHLILSHCGLIKAGFLSSPSHCCPSRYNKTQWLQTYTLEERNIEQLLGPIGAGLIISPILLARCCLLQHIHRSCSLQPCWHDIVG